MRRHITVKFVDFWPTFDCRDNRFVDSLRVRHDVEVLTDNDCDVPDILFYSRCGCEYLKYDCLKIYFTGENDFPNFNECDYAMSFYDIDFGHRHLRYPLYMLYEINQAINPPVLGDEEALNRGFCSVVVKNTTNCDPKRLEMIDAVASYKQLAYGGPFRNNVGGPVQEKIPFIAGYKFNLAFENSKVDGYVTEKLLEPLAAATVPIYWGSSEYAKNDFNPESFINIDDYDSMESFLSALKLIDSDPQEYLKILRAPNFRNQTPYDIDSRLVDFLDNIVTSMRRYVVGFGEMKVYHEWNKVLMPFARSVKKLRILKLLTGYRKSKR